MSQTDKEIVDLDNYQTKGSIRVCTANASVPLAHIRRYDGQHGNSMVADSDVKIDRSRLIIGSHNDKWF